MGNSASPIVALLAVHNRLSLTQRCLSALRLASRHRRLQIVVVDDGSTDGTAGWLAGQPDVTLLRGDGGLWFGGATDLGLRHVLAHHPDYNHVLILNNDTFVYPEALDMMVEAGGAGQVVAAGFWIEDRELAGSAGFLWENWWGLRDVCVSKSWLERHGAGNWGFMPVDAVATTLTLIPMGLLQRTRLPDPRLHPHNRYDAILSARMRVAGASFLCSTACLAGHLYGPISERPSTRTMDLAGFLHESFSNPRSMYYLSGNFALVLEAAPNLVQKCWVLLRQVVRFVRQLAWVSLNFLRLPGSKVGQTAS